LPHTLSSSPTPSRVPAREATPHIWDPALSNQPPRLSFAPSYASVPTVDEHTQETWRDVPGYEGVYRVSDAGRVQRWLRSRQRWKPVKGWVDRLGYHRVCLCSGGSGKFIRVHQLVLMAFVGPPPPDHECCHGNGVRTDNRLENLRWGTRVENAADAIIHGTSPRGERNASAKLSEAVVRSIILPRLRAGHRISDIARDAGVVHQTISEIKQGHNWAWLTGGPVVATKASSYARPRPL
jgi:hypothetical protein